MDYEKKYNDLACAIRNNTPYYDLTRMVGPSQEETDQAQKRLQILDNLAPHCNWKCACPSQLVLEYRKRYNRQVAIQNKYEEKYF